MNLVSHGRLQEFPATRDASSQTETEGRQDQAVQTTREEMAEAAAQTELLGTREVGIQFVEAHEQPGRYEYPPPVRREDPDLPYRETQQALESRRRELRRRQRERARGPTFDELLGATAQEKRNEAEERARIDREEPVRRFFGVCFNCRSTAHRYPNCPHPPRHTFCFRCGLPGKTVKECPRCAYGWEAQGPYRPGETDEVERNRVKKEAMREYYR
ncbi:hypothetical protein KPH14_012999, partial [Odynerus spinipes]